MSNRIFIYILIFLIVYGCSLSPSQRTPSPCVITAPAESNAEQSNVVNARAGLTLLGSDILYGGFDDSSRNRLRIIYQEIPDSLMACQMLLQLGACLAEKDPRIGLEYSNLMEEHPACFSPINNKPSVIGSRVFIHVADASQNAIGRSIQVALGDGGFLAPAIENMNGIGMPAMNEVRYYYESQFNDAKLVKRILNKNGVSNVIIKPMYDLPIKPPLEKGVIEVWLPNK